MSSVSRALLLASLFVAGGARAAPALRIDAAPVLGTSTAPNEGWISMGVRLENPGASPVSGYVELLSRPAWSADEDYQTTRSPFALPPHAKVALQLPGHGYAGRPAKFELRVIDNEGNRVGQIDIGEPRDMGQQDPLLFDLHSPSRIAAALRGTGLVVTRGAGGYQPPAAQVSSPSIDAATGEPILPHWPAAYASATLVVCSGRRLATLPQSDLVALTDWVLAGGALALALDRPEDQQFPALEAILGGSITQTAPAPGLLDTASFFVATQAAPGSPSKLVPSQPQIQREDLAPPARLLERLHGYSGGNLRVSPWGASASYGLGEVHLLAFPVDESAVSDRWVALKLTDLLRHAWEREGAVALPLGHGTFDESANGAVRRVLDPNESMRAPIVISVLVLLLYAVLAGPLNFFLAARKGRPLKAVLRLPVFAGITLLTIVAIGVLAKGVRGKARRLTLVEAGAGMSRAAATRFRALYAPSARELVVRTSAQHNLLEVASEGEPVEHALTVDREGARLEQLRSKPWQTMVVREDGMIDLAGGVSVVASASGEVTIKNRTARDLVGVIVKPPTNTALYAFPRIGDGASVSTAEGQKLAFSVSGVRPRVSMLGSDILSDRLDKSSAGLGAAWGALEAYAGGEADWWPPGVPVLIAQIEGGEGKRSDTGLRVDSDRMLLRVVGAGGVP